MTDPRDNCPEWAHRCGAYTAVDGTVRCRRCERAREEHLEILASVARVLRLVWCEATAQEEWREWSDIPRVTEMDRELAVGRAVRLGIIKVGA